MGGWMCVIICYILLLSYIILKELKTFETVGAYLPNLIASLNILFVLIFGHTIKGTESTSCNVYMR